MLSAHEIQSNIDEKSSSVEAILACCKSEGREPSGEEQVSIDKAFGTDGKPGEIEQMQAQMKNRAAIEAKQREIAASKLGSSVQRNHEVATNKIVVPANAKRHMGLRAFANTEEGEKEAYIGGQWLLAKLFNHQGAKDFLKRNNLLNVGDQQEASTLGLEIIPAPLEAALLKRLVSLCPILSKVRVSQMSSLTHTIPDRLTGTTVVYPAELASITASNLTFGQITLTAVKMAALTQVSNEVQADGVISMIDTVIEDFAYQLALKTEQDIFLGDGTATYGSRTGLASGLNANSIVTAGGTTVASIDLADIESVVALNPFFQGSMPEFYMSMSTYSKVILPILAAQGGASGDEVVSGWNPRIFGFPINICQTLPSTDAVSTNYIYFGDMSMSVFYGQRQGVELRVSDVAGDAFATDSVYCRAVMRNAITVNNHDSASAGAVTAIETAAA